MRKEVRVKGEKKKDKTNRVTKEREEKRPTTARNLAPLAAQICYGLLRQPTNTRNDTRQTHTVRVLSHDFFGGSTICYLGNNNNTKRVSQSERERERRDKE